MPQRDRTLDERIRSNEPERPTAQPRREPPPAGPPLVSALGNAAVQRLLRATQSEEEAPAADDAIAGAIEAERGGGQALDEDAAERFGQDFGADLSGVRVHEDSASDVLNKAVQAEAFTTGADIFFREGQYQPGSTEGDRLLAHELTHVVQQESSPAASGSGLEVSDPQDASEREADAVAQQLTAAGGGVERQVEEEEELMMSPALDRQVDEEEELMMSPALDRQVDEEEELMMSPALDRQVDEEEELMMSPALDRQVDEEEELMMSPALDRQEEEEEELMMSPALDRQVEEEEELMMSPALDRQVDEEEELMPA